MKMKISKEKEGIFKILYKVQNQEFLRTSIQTVLSQNFYFKSLQHVAPNQVKDATDEDFENIFQPAAFFQTLLKNFLEVTRS